MRRSLVLVAGAGAFGLTAQLLFYGQVLGANAAIAVALFLGLAWQLRLRRIDVRDAWIPALAVAFGVLLAIRTEPAVVAFDAVAAFGLTVASAAALGGPVMTLPLVALLRCMLATLVAVVARALEPIAAERTQPAPFRRARAIAPYAAGIGMAVPLLGVFGLLFGAADDVFARAMRDALRDLPDVAREIPGRMMLAAAVAWATAGTLTLLAGMRRESASDLPRPLRVETAATMLVALDILFALFVAIQVAYLFGGRDTLDAAGITYSAYARRGFFELVAASTLVAGVLFAVELFTDRARRAHLVPALALVLLTGVILASASYRLDLYQQAYGWSELRFHAIAAVAFLAVALVVLAWALVARRMAFALQPVALAALLVAVAVNVIGPSTFVARANVSRALDPSSLPDDAERALDVLYLYSLGDPAVTVLVEALPALPERERACLDALLRWQVARRDLTGGDARSWNYDRARAADALRSFASTIAAPLRDDHVGEARRARQLQDALRGCR